MDKPKTALIFDFDGVIADTEYLHFKAYCAVAETYGISCSWNTYLEKYIGYDDRDLFRHGFADAGRKAGEQELPELIRQKAAAFLQCIETDGVEPYPGVISLIHSAAKASIPLALCSGALQSDVMPVLRRFDLFSFFAVISTAEDVVASKPDPAPYLHAVEALKKAYPGAGIEKSFCVAVEDTPSGICSAAAAGLKVLAVTHTHTADALQKADRVVESLGRVSIEFINEMVQSEMRGNQ